MVNLQGVLQALRELKSGTWYATGDAICFTAETDDVTLTINDVETALHGDGVDDSLTPETIALIEAD